MAIEAVLPVLAVVLALGLLLWLLRTLSGRPVRRRREPAARSVNWILVDGSNVMHWQDNVAHLAPLQRVVEALKSQGFAPGVVFDANAGWKLANRYLNETEFARMLGLPRDQVFVAPKGSPADPYLLTTARKFKARIVTNDRFRDWAETYPEVAEKGFLIRGGMRDGQPWLQGVVPAHETAETLQN